MSNIAKAAYNLSNNALKRFMYLPVGWDDAWKTAKAKVSTSPVYITGIGDSIMAGQGSTDCMATSYWALLRNSLLQSVSNKLGGDHYGLNYCNRYGVGSASAPMGFATSNPAQYYTGFNQAAFNGAASSSYMTFNSPYPVTGFDLWYIDYATDSFTYTVDSGSPVTVSCTGGGTWPGAILKKVSITGLTLASHTLTVAANATANSCNIVGVTCYASNNGLFFANMGCAGMGLVTGQTTGNSLSDTAHAPVDRLGLYQGYQGTTASPTALTGFGFPTQPDLAIVSLGVNDANQTVARNTYRDALLRVVWSLRYGKNDQCSIVLIAPWTIDGTIQSSTTVQNMDYTSGVAGYYHDIQAAMREVAETQNCAYIDVHGLFGRTPITNGWVTSTSNLHPTNAGHQKMANIIASIL